MTGADNGGHAGEGDQRVQPLVESVVKLQNAQLSSPAFGMGPS